jgi:signal transduction histidine kinase
MAAGEVLRLPRFSREQVASSMQPEYWRYLEKVGSTLIAPLRDRSGVFGHITLLRDLPGQPYSRADKSLLEDLSSRAAQAIENARLYRQAQSAVAARDEFLSIASHELRTPLGALKLSLENTRRIASGPALGGGPSPFLPRVLETAERQGLRLEKLVAALLDVSRIQTGKLELELEETDLGAIATEVLSQFSEELAMAGCVVSARVGGPAPGIWDRFRIAQVVTNLVSNALKYGEGRPIDITVESGGGLARLAIRDHGIGIPAEAQRHIFGRFERAVSSRNYGGLGLGLYIVKSIVDAHGGTVAVESEPGAGSTFLVELPSRHVLAVEGRAAG